MFLLDTNVLSELRKGRKSDPAVSAWAQCTDLRLMHVSVISIMEIRMGILRVERRDQSQAAILARWLDASLLPAFKGRILDVTLDVAETCANLHVPDPRPDRDALIAATAIAHGMTVATRNTKDFIMTGVSLFNPWEFKA